MAISGFAIFGFAVPLILLAVNLVLGYGGILVTIALFVWIGTAIVLLPSEESPQP